MHGAHDGILPWTWCRNWQYLCRRRREPVQDARGFDEEVSRVPFDSRGDLRFLMQGQGVGPTDRWNSFKFCLPASNTTSSHWNENGKAHAYCSLKWLADVGISWCLFREGWIFDPRESVELTQQTDGCRQVHTAARSIGYFGCRSVEVNEKAYTAHTLETGFHIL